MFRYDEAGFRVRSAVELPEDVTGLIRRVPLWDARTEITVEPLSDAQSLNNAGYRVTAGKRRYAVRVASASGRHLGIRRDEELEAARAAASAGVGPKVFYAEPEGHLVMAYVTGRHWDAEEFARPENIARVAETLKALHAVTAVRGDGAVYRRVERLIDSARELAQDLPPYLPAFRDRLVAIEQARRADPRFRPGLAHNDFWYNNFLDDGERLWLVDWEFAGNGDGMFDLATTALGGRFGDAEKAALLQAYGWEPADDLTALRSMEYVVLFFEAAWSLVQHGLRGSAGYDYLNHSKRMFERMTAAS
jgi:thiamine kinase-like enzyme